MNAVHVIVLYITSAIQVSYYCACKIVFTSLVHI